MSDYDMEVRADRVRVLLNSREFTIKLSMGTERRVKQHIRRLNAHPDFNDPADHLDPDDDVSLAVTIEGLIETALAVAESDIGVVADIDGSLRPIE